MSPGEHLSETTALSNRAAPIELTATPFYPQEELQCGPAALATVLDSAGSRATPDALVSEVYVPGLEGSLQPELLGAIRRRGLLAYELPPTLEGLAAELVAGRPVLVLQNLGLASRPIWHYAVVIGADASTETVTLRSGREQRLQMSSTKFMSSWDKAGRWALVVLHPDEAPADPRRERLHRAVLGLEAAGRPAEASQAWRVVLHIWPDDSVALFGLGNARYSLGDLHGARVAWERYVKQNPAEPSGLNNLAVVLGDLGCRNLALELARATLNTLAPDDEAYPQVFDTVSALEGLPVGKEPEFCRTAERASQS